MPERAVATRSLSIRGARIDEATRTVHSSLSSEMPVRRGGEIEILRHEPDAIDLTRAANGGLPLLFGHDQMQPIGVIENIKLVNRRLEGDLRFGQSAKAVEVWRDVADGVLSNVSVKYLVQASEPIKEGYVATRWTLYEASIVSLAADHTVGVGRSLSTTNPSEGTTTMEVNTLARDLCTRHRLGDAFATQLNARSLDEAGVRAAVLDELARRDEALGGRLNVVSQTGHLDRTSGNDTERAREEMSDALAARLGGPPLRGENAYRHVGVVEMARECLELRGVRTTSLSRGQLIERALSTTSDFPNLLAGTGQRVLRQAYNSYQGGVKRAFKPSTAVNFRAKQRLMLGEAAELLKVNEHGEFKHGAMAESKGSYSLGTYGRIFGLTRQGLINDDLDAFGDMAGILGRAAAEFEAKHLVTLLTSNPTMYDAVALFHADHGNLATGGGSALQLSALTTMRKSMRLQKGLDGATPIDATPKYLIVPAALETTGEQLIASITPAAPSDVNPFAGKLELVVDPRLDAVSATAWYLAADPATIDTIEYSYLESEEGPRVFMEEGWAIDGVEFKVRLDFGAGALDWRGLCKSAGA